MIIRTSNNKEKWPQFPYVTIGIVVVLTFFTLILFAIVLKQRLDFLKYEMPHLSKAIQLQGFILQLDEALTMSAYMAIATGDAKWEVRYNKYAPVLVDAINELITLTSKEHEAAAATNIANVKLVEMERRSFNFVKQGKLREAKQIMYSQEYENQKNIYFSGMIKYYDLLQSQMIKEVTHKENETRYLLLIISLTFGFAIVAWILLYKNIRRWKMALDNALLEQYKYQKQLEASQTQLEQRVHKRTLELNEKNQGLSAALQNLQLIQKNLMQSEKMAMIGQLSAGVAHEINNPLSFTMSNVSILGKRFTILSKLLDLYQNLIKEIETLKINVLDNFCKKINSFNNENKIPAIVADVDNIISESTVGLTRIKEIVSNLGSFSNLNQESLEHTNINNCIETAIEIIWNELKYKIDLHKNLSDLPIITASPNQLKLVFMNLLLNSVQAIKEKGEITIVSKVVDSNIVVTVTDNGCGIPPENIAKMFTPFFTTKSIGTGMGLGLATAYAIVKLHDGDMMVESKLGSGSTFTVQIPIHSS